MQQKSTISAPSVILCYADVPERLRFFARLAETFHATDTELVLITHKLSVFLMGKQRGVRIYLASGKGGILPEKLDITQCVEMVANIVTHSQAARLCGTLLATFEELLQRYHVTGLLNWNGGTLSGAVTRHVAQYHKLPLLFLEIGNFPGKLFVDPEGTNSDASIAKNPKLLLDLPADKGAWKRWKTNYITAQYTITKPPQAKAAQRVNPWFPVDWLGVHLLGLPATQRYGLFDKLYNQKERRLAWEQLNHYTIHALPKAFVFLPLQVSGDTNLLLRSKVDNLQAIDKALAFARKKKLPLVVKPHPAENSPAALRALYDKIHGDESILVSNAPITTLLQQATDIFTINSTAGLEAMLLSKKPHILGDALYSKWQEKHIMHYLLGYLLDAPYFSDAPIDTTVAVTLLKRLGR